MERGHLFGNDNWDIIIYGSDEVSMFIGPYLT